MNLSRSDRERLPAALAKERKRLYGLLDQDPREAVAAARRLAPTDDLDQLNVDLLRAAVFVDAGGILGDGTVIEEGVAIFRQACLDLPRRPDLAYNLANGLGALAQVVESEEPPWFLATAHLRREARRLFEDVSSDDRAHVLRSQAHTNQANLLAQSFRWVEAYDGYAAALRADPANGVASSGLAKLLLGCAERGIGKPEWLRSLAAKYIRKAQESGARTRDLGGERALRVVQDLGGEGLPEPELPDLSRASEYARFVARNGLAISLTLEGLDSDARSWDTLVIGSFWEGMDADDGVPPIFAMWNVLKADYLAARWIAYSAASASVPETGSYSDTLDYANYGVPQSLWTLAQRSAIDILDRIAVAASEYLELPGSSRSIYFVKRWHLLDRGQLRSPVEWIPEIRAEIEEGNTAVIALAELAEDIAEGGSLNPKRSLRNSSTHRFVVLHDMSEEGARSSRHIEHYSQASFEAATISSLRLVRSALLYFLEMVAIREARQERESGPTVNLEVLPHHWIRGEDP